ncbi:hypothetical protein NLG97_g1594 [Lecanicillium saksenae]|uniref:Uncharacterized protein n=1 Tax=Lecanicillium saksenae TaxID=468837 RepID=A0ACC1R584_9HYPO|nr:hypothetical protein NLG97_g1594 [Lecanicillium saksenae]
METSERQYLVTFGPSANCTFELCTIDQSVYGYRPSLPANAIFAAIFSLIMAAHTFLGLRWKTPGYMWCMILGCIHEITGYVGRIIMWNNPWSFTGFIIQIICITQAPVFFCAAIYMTLGRTIEHCAPYLGRISPKRFVQIFLPCDIISLILQGAGGALSATTSGTSQVGVNVALAGLIFQIITLVGFCGLFGDFLIRYLLSTQGFVNKREGLFLSFLTTAVLIILARCIFRADELKDGYNGTTVKDEGLFIGLEGVLMVIALCALCIGHPGFLVRPREHVYQQSLTSGKERDVELTSVDTRYAGATGTYA